MALAEGLVLDPGNPVADLHAAQRRQVSEIDPAEIGHSIPNHEARQGVAVAEQVRPDRRHAVGNHRVGHADAP